jgi:hypothetical protein
MATAARFVARIPKAAVVAALLAAVALGALACSDGAPSPQDGEAASAFLMVSDLAVGENRFAFTMLAPGGHLLDDARVYVRFFLLHTDGRDEYRTEAEANFRRVVGPEPHAHGDGTAHFHVVKDGIYVVDRAVFDEAGVWQARVDIGAADGRGAMTGMLAFQVDGRFAAPALGDSAPPSLNPTAADVADLWEITTHEPPVPGLYDLTVAEALDMGRPFVVAFSTPAFCVSEVCGPVTDFVAQVYDEYGDRADFIHIEPWDLDVARTEGRLVLTDVAREWGLPTEPWVFVMGPDGRVAARFEGLFALGELRGALDVYFPGPTPGAPND